MHAGFGLQPAIGVLTLDQKRRRLDAGGVAVLMLKLFDLIAMRVGPARIHAQQHRGPILALGAAGAGIDLEVGVIAVGLAGEQRFEFGFRGALLGLLQSVMGFIDKPLIAFRLSHFGQFQGVAHIAFQRQDRVHAGLELIALAHKLLGLLGIVPKIRALAERVQFIETDLSAIPVKDASAAKRRRRRFARRVRKFQRAWISPEGSVGA